MAQTIVNLAVPLVTEKIEEILNAYPCHPHQQTFTSPNLRQKLTAYVLSRMPTLYLAVDEMEACSIRSPSSCYTAAQHSQIDRLIHQGIEHILQQSETWMEYRCAEQSDPNLTPSHWFG